MRKIDYIRKQPETSSDYKSAHEIVSKLDNSTTIMVDDIKRFRKYLHDLASKEQKEFSTKKRGANTLEIIRFS
jgi:hypothetical protein